MSSNIGIIINKIGDKDRDVSATVQKFISKSIKLGGVLGNRVILAIDGMINRKNLYIKIKEGLVASLASTNFEEIADNNVLLISSQIFMREFLANCSYREDSEKVRLMTQCLRGLNKIIPNVKNRQEIKKFYENHTD